jgi:flagellar basal-body rod protein FlgC
MTIFPVFDITSSALTTNRVWMDAIADNLANVNTVKPFDQPAFQARFIQAQELPSNPGDPVGVGGGVTAAAVKFGDSTGIIHSDPGNPLANKQGLIRSPDVDVAQNMTDLIIAQRAYELNLSVVQAANQSYQQAIQINGK